ncbi:M23 family metallopeptidase, partial [Leptospira santarosai]|uniref:M23 family metallopeptidase n=1 Tax=Leptospira santarosai TaxID=28183 RepID=UPI000ADC426B
QTGLSSNSDFLSQSAMNNGLSQGVAQTDEEKAHTARVEAEERARAAQNRNNSEQGASNISGAGVEVAGRRNEGDDGTTPHANGEPAGPVDQRIAQLKKELSEGILLADGNGSMSDAKGGSGEVAAAKELSKKMAELQKLEGQKAAGQKPASSNVLYGGALQNVLGSITDGAKGLWNRVTGGGNQKPEHSSSPTTPTNGGIYEKDGIRMPYEFRPGKDGDFNQLRAGGTKIHGAIDFIVPEGTPVRAVADGVVGKVHDKPSEFLNYKDPNKTDKFDGGAAINISHRNAEGKLVSTYYAHNSQILVKRNQPVKKGDIIAYSGNSGTSGEAHSHFTIYLNGNQNTPTDPRQFNWDKEGY